MHITPVTCCYQVLVNAPTLMYTSHQSTLAVLPIHYLQIIPPHDTGIAAAIEAQSELWKLPKDTASSPLVTDPLRMVTQRYYYSLQQELSFRPRQDNPKAAPVVYTPLHGVGLPWLQKVPWHRFLHQAHHVAVLFHLLSAAVHKVPVRIAKNVSCFSLLSVDFSFSLLIVFRAPFLPAALLIPQPQS